MTKQTDYENMTDEQVIQLIKLTHDLVGQATEQKDDLPIKENYIAVLDGSKIIQALLDQMRARDLVTSERFDECTEIYSKIIRLTKIYLEIELNFTPEMREVGNQIMETAKFNSLEMARFVHEDSKEQFNEFLVMLITEEEEGDALKEQIIQFREFMRSLLMEGKVYLQELYFDVCNAIELRIGKEKPCQS